MQDRATQPGVNSLFVSRRLAESVPDLFRAYRQRLIGHACRLTDGDIERAEDLVSEAFLWMTRQADATIDRIQTPYAYLSRMVTNGFLGEIERRSAQRREAELPAGAIDDRQLALIGSVDWERRQEQQDLILRICGYTLSRMKTSGSARVLLLRYFHGYSPNEIAQVLGMTIGTVEKALSRARAELRTVMSGE